MDIDERVKFLMLGLAGSFVLMMWNVGDVIHHTGDSDSKTLMLVGIGGFLFFGYKMFRVGK
ncbi:hypothetical protein [Desulforhopalus sp. 52FAK]